METGSPPRLPALDALRAVGAIAVVACHVGFNTGVSLSSYWGGFLARFDVGVAIFFALSGFLLFRPYAHAHATGAPSPDTRRYLWRRALRILPAYWLAVVGYLLVVPQTTAPTAVTWLEHLTLTQVYGFLRFADGFGHTWSLCTEVAFYAALPLLARLVLIGRWRPVRVIAATIGIGVAVTVAWLAALGSGLVSNHAALWLPGYAIWFAAGMALAAAHVALSTGTAPARLRILDEIGAAPAACWAIAAAALAVATTPIAGARDLDPPSTFQFATKLGLYSLVAVMLLTPLAFGPADRLTKAFASAPARWLGTVSYGLFLWHPWIIALLYRPGGRTLFTGGFAGTFLLVLLGGLALAAASYYLVERPLMRNAGPLHRGRHRPPSQRQSHQDDRDQGDRLGEPVLGPVG
ncbi:MAG: acyltransferase [Hamadaea sp.]|nr:acyltransferase [Hamadaea sp.]